MMHGGERAEQPIQVGWAEGTVPGEHRVAEVAHHRDQPLVDPVGGDDRVAGAGWQLV